MFELLVSLSFSAENEQVIYGLSLLKTQCMHDMVNSDN